jgi:hypothetical protein
MGTSNLNRFNMSMQGMGKAMYHAGMAIGGAQP